MTLILHQVSKTFNGVRVLSNLDLMLAAGARVALSGPSGVGKTTLLRLIAGLERPDQGDIHWNGHLYVDKDRWLPPWQRQVSMVFQDLAVWPHLTVVEHVMFALRSRQDISRSQRKLCASEILSSCHIAELSRRYPSELSGGQQQRLALARALAAKPDILLFDEPFTGLDTALKAELWSELLAHHSTDGWLMIVVSHDLSKLKQDFDEIYALNSDGITKVAHT